MTILSPETIHLGANWIIQFPHRIALYLFDYSNHRANGWLGGARRELWEFAPAAAEPSIGGHLFGSRKLETRNACKMCLACCNRYVLIAAVLVFSHVYAAFQGYKLASVACRQLVLESVNR